MSNNTSTLYFLSFTSDSQKLIKVGYTSKQLEEVLKRFKQFDLDLDHSYSYILPLYRILVIKALIAASCSKVSFDKLSGGNSEVYYYDDIDAMIQITETICNGNLKPIPFKQETLKSFKNYIEESKKRMVRKPSIGLDALDQEYINEHFPN